MWRARQTPHPGPDPRAVRRYVPECIYASAPGPAVPACAGWHLRSSYEIHPSPNLAGLKPIRIRTRRKKTNPNPESGPSIKLHECAAHAHLASRSAVACVSPSWTQSPPAPLIGESEQNHAWRAPHLYDHGFGLYGVSIRGCLVGWELTTITNKNLPPRLLFCRWFVRG